MARPTTTSQAATTTGSPDAGRATSARTGAVRSGAQAYAEAGVTARDIQYASIYDNFTISVIMQLEDMGFCEKGQGGKFVRIAQPASAAVGIRRSSELRSTNE